MSAVFGGRDVIDGDRDSRPGANLKQNVDSDSSGFCSFEAACRHNESYVKRLCCLRANEVSQNETSSAGSISDIYQF